MAQISEWVRRYYRQFPKNGFILDFAGYRAPRAFSVPKRLQASFS